MSVFDKRRKGAPDKEYQLYNAEGDVERVAEHDKQHLRSKARGRSREVLRLTEDSRPYWTEDWSDEEMFCDREQAKRENDARERNIESQVSRQREKYKSIVYDATGQMLDWDVIERRIRLEDFSPTTLEKLRQA